MKHLFIIAMLVGGTAVAGELSNSHTKRINALSETERSDMLAAAVQREGKTCSPAKSNYQGTDSTDGTAYYLVTCQTGTRYLVSIANDTQGHTRVADCDHLKMIDVDCDAKFD